MVIDMAIFLLFLFLAPDAAYSPSAADASNYATACVRYRVGRMTWLRAHSHEQGSQDELKYLEDKSNLPLMPLTNFKPGSIGTIPKELHLLVSVVENQSELTLKYEENAPPILQNSSVRPADEAARDDLIRSLSPAPAQKIARYVRVSGIPTAGKIAGREPNLDGLFFVEGTTQGFDAMPILVPVKDQTPLIAAWKSHEHIK